MKRCPAKVFPQKLRIILARCSNDASFCFYFNWKDVWYLFLNINRWTVAAPQKEEIPSRIKYHFNKYTLIENKTRIVTPILLGTSSAVIWIRFWEHYYNGSDIYITIYI